MKRQVAYVVNGDSLYMEMTKTSIHLLRQHNADVPVVVFLVDDPCCRTPQDFFDFCLKWSVEIRRCENLSSNGYFQENKAHLGACEGERILLLDSDTFVFDDVDKIFEKYAGFDVVACSNDWVWSNGYRAELIAGAPVPINSGVVMCSLEFLRDWTEQMPHLHRALGNREAYPALTDWLYSVSDWAYNREEFGLTICSGATGVKAGQFDEVDCKLIKISRRETDFADLRNSCKIFHSLSRYWRTSLAHL